jgi:hypothetical protein
MVDLLIFEKVNKMSSLGGHFIPTAVLEMGFIALNPEKGN